MLYATKQRLAVRAGAVLVLLGLSVAMGGVAHAWPNKDVTVETDCDGATLTGHGFEDDGQVAQSIDWKINTEPETVGSLTPDAPTVTVELPPGHYTVTWKLVIEPGEYENGQPRDFDVPACPAPGAALSCVDEVLVLALSNGAEASVDTTLHVDVNGESTVVTVAPGQTRSTPAGVDEGEDYSIKVTADDSDFGFEESGVIDCVDDQTPPVDTTPTPPAPAKASTLPHTGSGFPTGTTAALAVFLMSAGGFMLTYRKGMLTIPRRRG